MDNVENVGYAGAAKITGIRVSTLYALVSRKAIPHIRLGRRHVLFSVAELRDWLARHHVAALSQAEDARGKHA